MERAVATSDTLDENLAVFVDENAHVRTVSMADVGIWERKTTKTMAMD
jgi:hypothetical protein